MSEVRISEVEYSDQTVFVMGIYQPSGEWMHFPYPPFTTIEAAKGAVSSGLTEPIQWVDHVPGDAEFFDEREEIVNQWLGFYEGTVGNRDIVHYTLSEVRMISAYKWRDPTDAEIAERYPRLAPKVDPKG